MYLPRSHFSDIGDVEVIEHEGRLHMFHLVLPNRDLIAHAVSEDGLSWTAVAPAISTGAPGCCDDDMIRTVSVTKRESLFYMLYTATARAEAGRAERVALATSRDLYTWEKSGGPVAEADPAFYETEIVGNRGCAFRDPKPFEENGRYTCLVCARTKTGPRYRRGCAAHLTSPDLVHWQSHPAFFTPGLFDELECPQLYKIGAFYYLFASVIEERSQRYFIAEAPQGPYRTPVNSVLFPTGSHYAGRVCRFQGKDIFACWTDCVQDGPHPYGLRTVLGEHIRYVPAILEIDQQPDGTLRLCTTPNWDGYQRAALPPFPDLSYRWGNTLGTLTRRGADLEAESPDGYSLFQSEQSSESFTLRGMLDVQGTEGGLVFCGDADGGGYFVRLLPSLHRAVLLQHMNDPASDRFIYKTLQEAHVAFDTGAPLPFILRSVGGEIEFSLGGSVLFSTVSAARTAGRLGVYAVCASVRLTNPTLFSMETPFNK